MRLGPFAIGVYHPKREQNIGTLWRSAQAFGASLLFTVGARYRHQASDTGHATKWLPLVHFASLDDLRLHLPDGWPLIGIECGIGGRDSGCHSSHPFNACYLLGAEDHGLSPEVLSACHFILEVPGAMRCLNVSVAGSIVLYDRARAARAMAAPRRAA